MRNHVSDEDLLRAWRDGDRRSGHELFVRHFSSVRRFFRNKVADVEAADLVQRTFEACLHAQEHYRGEGRFVAYLLKIARTQLHRWLRKHDPVRGADAASSLREHGISASALAARIDRHRVVLACLRRLPLPMQTILELHYWEGLDAAEIGAVMQMKPGAVRTRLSRAREALRDCIMSMRSRELEELSTIEAEARIVGDLLA